MTAVLGIDCETASRADLKSVGAWRYSLDPSTRVWCVCLGRRRADGSIEMFTWQPGEPVPAWLAEADWVYLAHNNAFERAIWTNVLHTRHGWPPCPPTDSWDDTQAHGMAANLPMKLEGLGAALGTPVQKDMEGHDLMKRMMWLDEKGENEHNTPANRARLARYCGDDVLTMFAAYDRVPRMIPSEQRLWRLHQKVNQRGLFLDRPFVKKLQEMVDVRRRQLQLEAWDLTDGELLTTSNPNKFKPWLKSQGITLPKAKRVRANGEHHQSESAGKQAIIDLVTAGVEDPTLLAVMHNRLEAARLTSLAKLAKVENIVDPRDGRLRDALVWCAAHPGRWSSRDLQVHNLPKDRRDKAEAAKVNAAVATGDLGAVLSVTDKPLEAISLALRSMVAAPPGCDLVAADYKAAQAMILAWLAGQEDVLEIFCDPERDIYIEDAAKIGSKSRDLGKLQRLGLGFQMGPVKAAEEAPKYRCKLSYAEAREVVRGFRKNNAAIVRLWADLENAVKGAIAQRGTVFPVGQFLKVGCTKECLLIQLPSGRAIRYWQPSVHTVKKQVKIVNDDGEVEEIEQVGQEIRFWTPGKDALSMVPETTYGGKLAENVTMGVERDCLGHAMLELDPIYPIVLHVHDSIAAQVKAGTGDVKEFERIMSAVPQWAPGLPLAASGYRDVRFRG